MLPTLALVLPVFLAGAQDAPDPAEVLREADRAFFRDTRARGLEGWLAHFAADAIVFPEAGDLVVGRAELRRHYTTLQHPPPGFLWEPIDAGLSSARDLGWTVGRWGNDGSGSATWAGRYLTVWRRSEGGAWQVVADCGGEPAFLTHLQGLTSAPASVGREALQTFRSADGDLEASLGAWWASAADGTEVGGKFLSVWRRRADGVQELVAETGFPQAKR